MTYPSTLGGLRIALYVVCLNKLYIVYLNVQGPARATGRRLSNPLIRAPTPPSLNRL